MASCSPQSTIIENKLIFVTRLSPIVLDVLRDKSFNVKVDSSPNKM